MLTLHLGQDIRETVVPTLDVSAVYVYDEEDPLFSATEAYHITTFSAGGARASGRAT